MAEYGSQKITYPLRPKIPISYKKFGGGLNTTSGPLGLEDSESSDLSNVEFDKFGSVIKRNGYTALNTVADSGSPAQTGIDWFELSSGTRFLVKTSGTKFYKMDDLDATWDDVSGAVTITSGNLTDFETFLDNVIVTDTGGTNPPFAWPGTGNAAAMTVPTGLTTAKYNKVFNNYLFLANVTITGTAHKSRIYWSDIRSISSWTSTSFIDIAKNDGQTITGLKVLGDRLLVFKERSIYAVFFTGDADIPFIVQKTNSNVGCASHFSIQEVDNGLVFLSQDGIYYFDGSNSFKISDRITTTLLGFNTTKFNIACAVYQKNKNEYWLAISSGSSTTNNRIIKWNMVNNAFSLHSGMSASCMTMAYVDGVTERVYFGDYSGFVYRADVGTDDYPLNVQTAISAYYYTRWFDYDDIVDQKATPHAYIYYRRNNATLTFAYAYDFEEADSYSQTFSTSAGSALYGTAVYGTDVYAGTGGAQRRRDLTGRGRVIRFKFANATIGETFRIDGLGAQAYLETHV